MAACSDEPIVAGSLSPEAVTVRTIHGKRAILACYPWLSSFASACGQSDAAEDLSYFLAKPGISARTPVLLCVLRKSAKKQRTPEPTEILGTLLLYEYSVAGIRTGLFTTNDRSGRTSLIAPAAMRSSVVSFAAQWLLRRGAHLVLLSFAERSDGAVGCGEPRIESPIAARWATRTRRVPDFLELRASFDETLASIGQRTRSNMRYYRRRAERELGCIFEPEATITESELLTFNRECMYAVPNRTAVWRLRTLHKLSERVLMALRDRDGRLLSLIGGRRLGTSTELLWQMNRDDLPQSSLSLVLRSYMIEHEIARGAKRFYVEGGSGHPIRHSFQHSNMIDLIVRRESSRAAMVCSLARRFIHWDNELAVMLVDSSVTWNSTRGAVAALRQKLSEPA